MKRLIYCLDGTWNTDTAPTQTTNVAKIHHAIAPTDGNGVQQASYYLDGIASAAGQLAQFLRGALGVGVSERIRQAYAFLMGEYEPGDEIYLFGFSRGAFEARSLAGFIELVGIGKRDAPFDVDKAWSVYREPKAKHSEAALEALRSAAHYPARIKCIGVWDTVGSIGNPVFARGIAARRQEFHRTDWSPIAEFGLHAVSIDETRGTFRPMLWTLPEGEQLPEHQHVEQVWFAGTHADVGGGWREAGLSDVALRWMVEQTTAKCGLAFDDKKLAATSRPDPLAAQHVSTGGKLFLFSRLIPFVRLVKQGVNAIPQLRRALLGTWRTGKVQFGQVPINESVHESAVKRFGAKVIELERGRARIVSYRPRSLALLIPERAAAEVEASGKPRRAKVFTVHGTFAHDTTWDNWDDKDNPEQPADTRYFINRLSDKLREQGVTLESGDHSQYNWSGGNSHDERRNAAIGLKKHILNVLAEDAKRHGQDYYDTVYIVGHSHGGTIARLAMNLWDKQHDYYDPLKSDGFDEFTHDDTCQVCMRLRNGIVGPGTITRPDGVITFGSPFVNFENRRAGILTAWLGAWVFRAFALAFVAIVAALAYRNADDISEFPVTSSMLAGMRIVWPVLITWLIASYLAHLILPAWERWFGKDRFWFAASALLSVIKMAALALLTVYLAAMSYGWWTETGSWLQAERWLPFISNTTLQTWLAWFTLIGVSWLLVITLPGRVLHWLKRDVAPLGNSLPAKYDPSEDRATKYISYQTPGDEAWLGLRFFGFLTWVIQTFGLAFASMLALGVLLIPLIAVDAVFQLLFGKGLLSPLGISAFTDDVGQRARFIALMDWLTYLPRTALSYFGVPGGQSLASMVNSKDVAWWIPLAIVLTLFLVFLLLMPVMLVLLGIAYLVAMWLRRTGLVFGGEGMAWNLASRIAVSRRANDNTAMRNMLLTPEAWWRKEMAHCYYYKSERVISDVAQAIGNWRNLDAGPAVPVGRWLATSASWLIVLITMLSIFSSSVPLAGSMNSLAGFFSGTGGSGVSEGRPASLDCSADADSPATAPLAPAMGTPNNLKRIRAIDASIEEKLNGLGVTTYEQIANWTCADIRTVGRSIDGLDGRITRENWPQQAGVLADGGTTSYSRSVDAAAGSNPIANAAPKIVKEGTRWCLSEPLGVAVKAVQNGRSIDSNAAGEAARPIWEAEVSKTYGAEWANWTGYSSLACSGDDCTVSANACQPRRLECQDAAVSVTYDFELAPGLSATAQTSITSMVLDDLKTKWSADVQLRSGPEWIAAREMSAFERPAEIACSEAHRPDQRIRYQCVFATAPCKDGPPPQIRPAGNVPESGGAP